MHQEDVLKMIWGPIVFKGAWVIDPELNQIQRDDLYEK
jgi:hypothetical protein